MNPTLRDLLLGTLLLAGLYYASEALLPPPTNPPAPSPSPAPEPCPKDGPCPPPRPRPRPKPWGISARNPVGFDVFGASVGGSTHADGTEVDCDLPQDLHVQNRGGIDGAGLCVFASLRHTGLWQDEPALAGLFSWMATKPGGGYPQKVDAMIAQYCQEKGIPKPAYVQVESGDLEVLRAALCNGLLPAVTYWRSPTGRYGGRRIAHMVSLVGATQKHFTILDNNYPGTYEWMSPDEFRASYTGGKPSGWAVIPLKAGPPPVPHNERNDG